MLIDGVEEQCTSVGWSSGSNRNEMYVMRKISGSMRPVSCHGMPIVKVGDKFTTNGHKYEVLSI
jgi:hypothetical protein